jgi:methylphosphotriester-DNA--protein-cysteine methyltransferase
VGSLKRRETMFKRLIVATLCLVILSPVILFAEDVFVTKQGTKYHNENCPIIANKDKEKISLEDAKAKGLTPCSKCIGKELSSNKQTKEQMVLVTENGKKYHKDGCNLIKSRKTTAISLEEATAKGLEPCRRCFPEMAKAEK